jgi:hypothetical protein
MLLVSMTINTTQCKGMTIDHRGKLYNTDNVDSAHRRQQMPRSLMALTPVQIREGADRRTANTSMDKQRKTMDRTWLMASN